MASLQPHSASSFEVRFYCFSFTNFKKKWDGTITQITSTSTSLLTHVVQIIWSWLKIFLISPTWYFHFADLFYNILFLCCLNLYSPVSPQSNVFKIAESYFSRKKKDTEKNFAPIQRLLWGLWLVRMLHNSICHPCCKFTNWGPQRLKLHLSNITDFSKIL